MVTIADTFSWDEARIGKHLYEITNQFCKLVRRFPHDLTLHSLFHEALSGRKRLWLVLDGDRVVGVAMTQLRTVEATGTKLATLCDLAGDDVEEWAEPLCGALETWAAKEGAVLSCVEGRPGWARLMKKFGYTPYACLWRKEL